MRYSIYDVVLKHRAFTGMAVLALVMFGLGFAGGWFSGVKANREAAPLQELRLGGYALINPLLECDTARDALAAGELSPFKYKIEQFVEQLKRRAPVSDISVYFREMNNGLSFGIGATGKFTPASLVKVPLMMAYFKAAENDPGLLSRGISYRGGTDQNAGQTFRPPVTLEPGRSYTVDDLIRAMIVHSDNNAYFLLFGSLDPRVQKRVYTDLGLEIPKVRTRDDYMSVQEYAAFFRILYNASYLTRDHSEKALQYLSEVDFPYGIVAGVPPNVTVAHKFGERTLGEHGEIKQLHDCGIVYYPNHPYLLCVMSRGASFEYLDDSIREISRIAFEAVDGQYRGK